MVFMAVKQAYECWRTRVNGECMYNPLTHRCESLYETRECLLQACLDDRCRETLMGE